MGKRSANSHRNRTLTTGIKRSGIIEVNGVKEAYGTTNRKKKECKADGIRDEGTMETTIQGMSTIIIIILRGLIEDKMRIGY